MRRSVLAGALVPLLASFPATDRVAAAPCQKSGASAPYIGAADMQAIDRAAEQLPTAPGGAKLDVGSAVPPSVKRAPIPGAVAKVLPQYKGYSAFRSQGDLMIVDPRGILSYMMPLRGSANPGNCP